jgi:hypothetical protein
LIQLPIDNCLHFLYIIRITLMTKGADMKQKTKRIYPAIRITEPAYKRAVKICEYLTEANGRHVSVLEFVSYLLMEYQLQYDQHINMLTRVDPTQAESTE